MSNIIDTTTDIQFYSDGKPEVYTNVENKLLCIEQEENLLLNCVQIDWQEAHLSHINDLLQSELGDSAPDNFNINTTEELLWIIDKLVAKAYGSVEKTANPTITATEQASNYKITATGAGTVLMYIGDSTTPIDNPYTVQRGETDQTIVFKATAQEENKLISDTVTKSVNVKKLTTATPTIAVTEGNTEYTIKATGNGTVTLYKGSVAAGNIVANPFTVQRTTVDQTITFKATAKEQGKAISTAASKQVTIPALPQEQTTYYWYVGQTDPSTITEISPIVTSTTEGGGWYELGTTVPSTITQLIKGGDSSKYWFVAVPTTTPETLKPVTSDMVTLDTSVSTQGTKQFNDVTYQIFWYGGFTASRGTFRFAKK